MSKRRLNWLAPVALTILAIPAAAQTQTFTGKLIDLSCYWQDTKNTGTVHNGRQLDWRAGLRQRAISSRSSDTGWKSLFC